MLKRYRSIGFIFPVLFMAPDQTIAQETRKVTSAGRPMLVRVFYNCGVRGYPNAAGSASNGTVSQWEARRNRCGNANHPVVEAIYTPNPGFRGTDKVIFHGGTRAWVDVTVP